MAESQNTTEGMQENADKWTANQRKFIDWLALPCVKRDPPTQVKLASQLNVNETTLTRWRKLPGFMQEVQELIRENLGDELHEVMFAFKEEAKKGSFQHQKLYFEMLGLHVDKQELTGAGGGPLTFRDIVVERHKPKDE